jgi:type II secretory pathway component PulF
MPLFKYRALKDDGSITEGNIEVGSRLEALRQLEHSGLNPVVLKEEIKSPDSKGKRDLFAGWKGKKVSFSSLENFTRQLSSLLAAGVSLSRALHILRREASSRSAREKWKELHDLVIDGSSLADAMARSPETFPKVYVAMIQAGEAGGFLDVVLEQIAEFQSLEKDLKSRIISALVYPAVLMFLAIAVLIYLLVFFIPRFKAIFSGFGAALPWLTRFIVRASEVMTSYGIFVALIAGVVAFIIVKWLKTEQGRRIAQLWILKIPIIGALSARFAMVRFCRMLGTLSGAGVPLINALKVARESIGNQTLTDAVTNTIERVRKGETLASSLADCPMLFPSSVLEMISVAEETGRLDRELVRIARVTEKTLDRKLRTTVALAEPLMLFIMAAFIGIIFIGMVIPIFTIQEYIK